MNLQQLRYFSALAETGHFGHAAKKLFITQPALSNSISKLENELGFSLFERTKEGVRLTPFGAEFNKHIAIALREIDEATHIMGPDAIKYSPTIRIGMVASVQNDFLPRLLTEHTKATQKIIDFDMHEERTTFQCSRDMNDDLIDLAFCGFIPREESLCWVPVCAQNACIAVNADHPLAGHKSVSLKELGSYPLISYRDNSYIHYSIGRLLQEYGLSFTQAFNIEINGAARVLADARVVAVMLDAVEGSIRDHICIIPIKELPGPFHMVGMTYRNDIQHSADVVSFIDYVKERHADLRDVPFYEERYHNLY